MTEQSDGKGSVFRDADRLAASVRGLTDRFGPEVLSDPTRVRNLLLDDYGVDARSERSDVDTFVSVLSVGVGAEEPLDSATARVVEATNLTEADARWSLMTARSVIDSDVSGSAVDPTTTPSSREVPGATIVAGFSEPSGGATADPVVARRVGGMQLAIAALALATLVAGVVAVTSRSELSDVRSELTGVRSEMEAAEQQMTDLAQESGANATNLGELIDELKAERDQLEARVTELQSDNAALDEDNQQNLAEVSNLQRQISALGRTISSLSEPFSLVSSAVRPDSRQFTATLTQESCSGPSNCANITTFGMSATFQTGRRLNLAMANWGEVPLASPDGLSYSGSLQVDWAKCENVVDRPTTMSVTMFPVSFHVEPETKEVTVDKYNVAVTMSAAQSRCAAVQVTYLGTIST